jgi:cell division septation protein DedD
MHDEGLHEIQLNGKQLVFLFMAATVVAVVVFLCGVMVGRGVPQRAGAAPATPEQAASDPTAAVQLPPPLAVASSGSTPITAGETLTYADRLANPTPPPETLRPLAETAVLTESAAPTPAAAAAPASAAAKPAPVAATPAPAVRRPGLRTNAAAAPVAASPTPAKPAPAAAAAKPPAPAPAAPKPSPAAAAATPVLSTSSLSEPAGGGFVVQVAAVRKREEAEAIARRLSVKGYPTFVTTSGANFRVRIGKYDNRREAESVAGRLEREERVNKPWITR